MQGRLTGPQAPLPTKQTLYRAVSAAFCLAGLCLGCQCCFLQEALHMLPTLCSHQACKALKFAEQQLAEPPMPLQSLREPLQLGLQLGLQLPALAEVTVSALERWEHQQPDALKVTLPCHLSHWLVREECNASASHRRMRTKQRQGVLMIDIRIYPALAACSVLHAAAAAQVCTTLQTAACVLLGATQFCRSWRPPLLLRWNPSCLR